MNFNAREYIDDMVATGISYDEAVVMAREEATKRREILRQNSRKQAAREARGDEKPGLRFWQGGYRGRAVS